MDVPKSSPPRPSMTSPSTAVASSTNKDDDVVSQGQKNNDQLTSDLLVPILKLTWSNVLEWLTPFDILRLFQCHNQALNAQLLELDYDPEDGWCETGDSCYRCVVCDDVVLDTEAMSCNRCAKAYCDEHTSVFLDSHRSCDVCLDDVCMENPPKGSWTCEYRKYFTCDAALCPNHHVVAVQDNEEEQTPTALPLHHSGRYCLSHLPSGKKCGICGTYSNPWYEGYHYPVIRCRSCAGGQTYYEKEYDMDNNEVFEGYAYRK